MTETIVVQCAWCGCSLDTSTGEHKPEKKCPQCGYVEPFAISHGICPECKARVLREHRAHILEGKVIA